MVSEIKSDKLSPSTATSLQLGDASDTVTIPTGATFTVTDGLGVAAGGTGLTSFTAGDILYATGTTTLAKLGKGTGLQGLQTNSGATAPEWANSPQSLMTAAGDVLYASGANTLAKLAKGSNDDVLTLASGVPSWAASGASGGCLQVKTTVVTAATATTTSTSFVDITGMTVDITPTLSTSKILVFCNFHGGSSNNQSTSYTLVRDSTQIYMGDASSSRTRSFYGGVSHENRYMYDAAAIFMDAPATTSATTYKMQWLAQAGTANLNKDNGDADAAYSNRTASSITAMEIAVGVL